MFKARIFFTSKQKILVCVLLSIISSCSTNTTASRTSFQQLRISNISNVDIMGLVVLFPELNQQLESSRVEFGNIPAGQISAYKDIPSGVYKYAAYEYTVDGHIVTQPVIDWVGESPMKGSKFTYQLLFDPKKNEGDQIALDIVLIDEP